MYALAMSNRWYYLGVTGGQVDDRYVTKSKQKPASLANERIEKASKWPNGGEKSSFEPAFVVHQDKDKRAFAGFAPRHRKTVNNIS